MLLINDLQLDVVNAIAPDTDWYGAVDAGVSVVARVPIVEAFVPSKYTVLADLVLPPVGFFDKLAITMAGTTGADLAIGPAGEIGMRLPEPLGGFTWRVVDEDLGPVQIFGMATVLLDGAGGDPLSVISTGLLPTPQTYNANGQIFQNSSIEGYFSNDILDLNAGAVPAS